MFITFKFAYQNWGTMTKEDVADEVIKGSITADEYKEIVGEDYVAPASQTFLFWIRKRISMSNVILLAIVSSVAVICDCFMRSVPYALYSGVIVLLFASYLLAS